MNKVKILRVKNRGRKSLLFKVEQTYHLKEYVIMC